MAETYSRFFRKNRDIIIKCVLAGIGPFLICLLYCATRGYSFFELYLPNSYNNDVLFYFKQVECIVTSGHPLGYFGFNESHAVYGGLAAWSPFLYLPWVIFCRIFGCNNISIICCNIVVFSLALIAFVLLSKIDWYGLGTCLLLLAFFPSFSIHLMNGLAETTVASALLLFFGFSVNIVKEGYRKLDIIGMFILASYLTLCRPFMVLLFILPCYYYIKDKGIKAGIISISIVVISVVSYFLCSHFLTSAYVDPLFNGKMIKELFTGQFSAFIADLKPLVKTLLQVVKEAFEYGLTVGTQYIMAGCAVLILTIALIRKSEYWIVYLVFVLTAIGLIGANVLLLCKINEGGRHIWSFAVVGFILCTTIDKKIIKYIGNGIVHALLILFIVRGAWIPTDYDIPKPNNELRANIAYLEGVFDEKGVAPTSENPWENTVIWACNEYNELYAIPKGMGINYCVPSYLYENIDTVQSEYVAVNNDSDLDMACRERNYEEVVRTSRFVMFKRY